MPERSMLEKGSLAITARGDGTRWYGRISIPEVVARKAEIQEGQRVTLRCQDGCIVVQQDDLGRIRFPTATGKAVPKHAFEAATATLGLKDINLPQCITDISVEDNRILIRVPEECLSTDPAPRRRVRRETVRPKPLSARPAFQKVIGAYGAAAAIITESNRAGKQTQPLNSSQIIAVLKEHGHHVDPLGPRLFKLDRTRSVSISDLLEIANKVSGTTDQNRIVLVMD